MRHPVLTTAELRRAIANVPRVRLAHLPTPLEEVPRFARRLGDVRIFLKRDDCTGLLFGGNKTRHNEFVMADAQKQGADLFVWGAGVQSNNCRQTAAACARLGLDCYLYLSRGNHGVEVQGNLLLDHLVGAKVEIVEAQIGQELEALLADRANAFRAAGRRPYVWSSKLVKPIGALSYTLCLAEILDELAVQELAPAAVYVSSAGATGAGVTLGKAVLGMKGSVRSICPIRWPWDVRADMADIANRAAARLDLPHRLTAGDVDATEDYLGAGYGEVSPQGREALDLLARTEGILLDPVYTAKAMAGLIDDVRRGRYQAGQVVVFIHTGGLPAVFAYRDEVLPERVRKD
jgi:1-aminocyclopropane-1-carboxylate deaminase/D-cysteine desulfhydrase-like pyridoxal-dependent ACC family enzyme